MNLTRARPSSQPTPSTRDPIDAWLDVFIRLLGASRGEAQTIRDELEDHLRSRVDDLTIIGVAEPDAIRRAISELGETADLAVRFRRSRRDQQRSWIMLGVTCSAAAAAIAISLFSLNSASTIANAHSSAGDAPRSTAPAITPLAEGSQAQPGSNTAAPHDPQLHRYDISAILDHTEFVCADMLMEVIVDLVSSDDWEASGGDLGRMRSLEKTLFVRAPEEMHVGVRWVLDSMHEQIRREAQQRRSKAQAARAELDRLGEALVSDQARTEILKIRIDRTHAMLFEGVDLDPQQIQRIEAALEGLISEQHMLRMRISDNSALRNQTQRTLIQLSDALGLAIQHQNRQAELRQIIEADRNRD